MGCVSLKTWYVKQSISFCVHLWPVVNTYVTHEWVIAHPTFSGCSALTLNHSFCILCTFYVNYYFECGYNRFYWYRWTEILSKYYSEAPEHTNHLLYWVYQVTIFFLRRYEVLNAFDLTDIRSNYNTYFK